MPSKLVKRCSIFHVIHIMQTKMGCHYTLIKIWNSGDSKCWQACAAIVILIHWWWECKMVNHFGRYFGSFLQTKHTITIRPSHPLPRYLNEGAEKSMPLRNTHTDVYSSLLHKCGNLEAIKMSLSRWMDKVWYIQKMEYHSDIQRKAPTSHEKKMEES